MAITAAEIHNQSFEIDRRGYDVDEVDVFLEHVADEIDNLNAQIAELEAQLDEAEAAAKKVAVAEGATTFVEPSRKDARIAELESQLAERQADANAVAQALIIAQRSADDILERANQQSDETIASAREEAQRIIDRANGERQDVLDAIEKLKGARENARLEYSDLLKDIIADASRKLATIGTTSELSGVAERQPVQPQAAVPVSANDLTDEFEILDIDGSVAEYTTPQTGGSRIAAAEPIASAYEKDLSGFGDADDSSFDEID